MKIVKYFVLFSMIGFSTLCYALQLKTDSLVKCLNSKGWAMYGFESCGMCAAQKSRFGVESANLNYVECDPNAENTDVAECVARKIVTMPTWLQVSNGQELQRLEGVQSLKGLATAAECTY